jgi:Sulfotransferase family
MLAFARGVGYIHEPFSPITPVGVSSARFPHFFAYVCDENEDRYLCNLERTLQFRYELRAQLAAIRTAGEAARTVSDLAGFARARVLRARPLVKDPIAVFSAEWMASTFDMDVVVCVRHPAAVASSLKRLGWKHEFQTFLSEPLLMRDYLARFDAEIREFARSERDVVSQAALLWRLIYHTVSIYRERHSDWIFLRHEDVSRDPVGAFERLYAQLGLELTPHARRRILAATSDRNPRELRSKHSIRVDSASNVQNWKSRLSAGEIEWIRQETRDVAPLFYSDDEW